ncbi:MAG TPA: NlpC/P60 family protein [Armatimonadota bacterium]|nr:NlpC/P60 family protein [Armatimonadota bacterium]
MRYFQTGRLRLLSGMLTLVLFISPVLADVTYTVKAGDSLSKIAHRYSMSLNELMSLNHITNRNKIAVGQVLKVDKTETQPDQQAENNQVSRENTERPDRPETSRSFNPRELAAERARLIQSQGNQVVDEARNYLGTPYRWAGLSSRGIDCSGLVVRSMAVLGKDVPHNAAALYQMGNAVSFEDLQPGDLVFFNTLGNGVSHVGIWVGDNQFIHASSSRGVVVEKMKGYFSKRLIGARRIN